MRKRAVYLGIYLLWFSAVFDPIGNLYYLRYVALVYSLLCVTFSVSFSMWSYRIYNDDRALSVQFILMLAVAMPVYGLFMYLLRGGGAEFVDTSYIAAGILILTALIYRDERDCRVGIAAMVFALRLLTLTIFVIYAFMFFGINYDWVGFFTESNVALIGIREYGGVSLPYIYFLASPMLIFLIAYDIYNFARQRSLHRLIVCILTMFAFALSGTRSHIVLAIAYGPLYYLLVHSKRKVLTLAVSTVAGVFLILLVNPDFISEAFSTKETSNEMKIGLLGMYLDYFSNPFTLFFGQGYNAHEWSPPLREAIAGIEGGSKTELTYFELVRVYGLPLSGIFYVLIGLLISRSRRLKNNYRWLLPAVVIFLLNTALNPYLFSTNGMLPLALLLGIVSCRACFRGFERGNGTDLSKSDGKSHTLTA